MCASVYIEKQFVFVEERETKSKRNQNNKFIKKPTTKSIIFDYSMMANASSTLLSTTTPLASTTTTSSSTFTSSLSSSSALSINALSMSSSSSSTSSAVVGGGGANVGVVGGGGGINIPLSNNLLNANNNQGDVGKNISGTTATTTVCNNNFEQQCRLLEEICRKIS